MDYGTKICPKCYRIFQKLAKNHINCNKIDCYKTRCLKNFSQKICQHCSGIFMQKSENQITCSNPTCKRSQKTSLEKKRYKYSIETQLRYAVKSSLNRPNMLYLKKVEDLQYSTADLMKHLEKNFSDGMCWDNRGACGRGKKYSRNPQGWNIGHIIPRNQFKDSVEGELCFWSLDNIIPEWQWLNQFKGMMNPSEMRKWLSKENILEKISGLLEEQERKHNILTNVSNIDIIHLIRRDIIC